MSLHIGDKILEVNGTPVKDQPIENIENLMRNSNNVLQVILCSHSRLHPSPPPGDTIVGILQLRQISSSQ